jgi:hypothetical protein
MSLIEIIRLSSLYEKFEALNKQRGTIMSKITQYVTLLASLLGTIGVPALATKWIQQPSHELEYSILVGVAILLHAAFPSIFSSPATTDVSPAAKSGMKVLGLAVCVLLLSSVACSQTTTTASTGFSTSAGPLAVEYRGVWSAASLERESYDFYDFGATKTNHVYVQGIELEMPAPGVNLYMGGAAIKPDLSSVFKKTNLPAGTLAAFFDGNVGVGTPSTGGSQIAWLAGGGVLYKINGALTWTPLTAQYGRFGSTGFAALSTQLQFLFGPAK